MLEDEPADLEPGNVESDQIVVSIAPKATLESKAKPNRSDRVETLHTVVAGDTLMSIAEEYSVELSDLVRWNGLTQWWLEKDQELKVVIAE